MSALASKPTKFPKVLRVSEACCFRCKAKLDPASIKESGYPDGMGAYRGSCTSPKCGIGTWFDLNGVTLAELLS